MAAGRSFRPSGPIGPEQADRTPADDGGDGDHDLGSLGDLLHLRKVIDALSGRHIESGATKGERSCN